MNIFCVDAQENPLDAFFPKTTQIESVQQYETVIIYFETAITYKRSEFSFSKEHLELAENNLIWTQQNEDEASIIRAKYYLFHYYNNQFNVSETIFRAKELLAFEAFLEMKESVFALYILKNAYYNSKEYQKLLKILPQYYGQRKKHGGPFGENSENLIVDQEITGAYANIYFNLKNYKQAQFFFKKRLNYLKSIKEYYRMASAQNNLGLSYYRGKKHDSAMYYFDEALFTLKTYVIGIEKDKSAYVSHFKNSIEANKASIYIKNGEYDRALPFVNAVLKSSKGVKEINLELAAYYDLAQIFYYKNKLTSSLEYLDKILNTYSYYKSDQLRIKSLQLKAKCLMQLGKVSQANNVFNQHQNLIDSLEQQEINRKYIEATVKLDVNNKEKELLESVDVIKKQDKIDLYQKIGIVSLVFLLIGFYFIYRNNKEKSKIISIQKEVVDKSLQQKETLLKEIHHRVKNNLQLISGLLNLQLQKHKHLEIKEMVNESQKHINSIAFAHEMLYQEEDLSVINMRKYLKELGARLLQLSLNNKISYKVNVENISLPINYATTLGLILNELITNSLKYAFKEEVGEVIVNLSRNSNNEYQFKYEDNGVGMNPELIHESLESLGLKLIKMFAEEIDAELEVKSEKGLSYQFIFKVKTQT